MGPNKDPVSSVSTPGYEEFDDHCIIYPGKYKSNRDELEHTNSSLHSITLVTHEIDQLRTLLVHLRVQKYS